MITIETKDFSQEQWQEAISRFCDINLLQLWEYGEAKRSQGWDIARQIFWKQGNIVGAAQGVIKKIPKLPVGIVWFNRAPLCQTRKNQVNIEMLQRILEALRKYWVDGRHMYMRIAPTLSADHARVILEQGGLKYIPNSQWFSARVDLACSEEELRMALSQGWRRGLKKAEAMNLKYKIGTDRPFFNDFLSDYALLMKRKRFKTAITPAFLGELQKCLPAERKMYTAIVENTQGRLGSIGIVSYGTVAEFLAGGVTGAGKVSQAGKLLFWQTILDMKRRGFTDFDVGGTNPDVTEEGILQFKRGLGGTPYQLIGKFEAYRGLAAHIIRYALRYLV